MATKDLKVRNVDSGLLERLNVVAAEQNISRNQLIINLLESLDPLENYQKLYAEQTHQQAQNTKALKEVCSKQDEILNILKSVDY
ncbi:hypothetical protein AST08_10230 [Staphylococcus saprophyticus]|uniref:hypothetical protein n=1 Tax=Staphylococcus saprophyticus TaxID=29385 RepID=UPI000853C583|nr:hypothetical protein [Staphylococcus saprophyticus]MDW4036333.1 hypothetical protein [Staphylococcus saprophyticus]OEK94012.1 hypothetical protein AST08_10230 [Staphylococcus saprophyticus]